MRILSSVLLCAAAALAVRAADMPAPEAAAGSAPPSASAPASEAKIPFADKGGIYNWQPVDDRTLLIESLDHHWYKATLMTPCFKLPFAERIGFQWNPDGSFDKFSAIQVGAQRCPLTSLVETTAPPKKSKGAKPAGAAPPPAAPAPPPAAPASPSTPASPSMSTPSGGASQAAKTLQEARD